MHVQRAPATIQNESPYYILARRLCGSNPLMILGSYFRKQFHIAFTRSTVCSSLSLSASSNAKTRRAINFFREPVALGFHHRSFGAPNFDPLHVFFNYFSTARRWPLCPGILVLISPALFEPRPARHGERKKAVGQTAGGAQGRGRRRAPTVWLERSSWSFD